MSASSSAFIPEGYTAADLRELHRQTVEVAVGASFGLAIGLLAFATFGLNRVDPELFAVVVGLLLSAALARGALDYGSTFASVVLVSGLIVVFAIALRIMPARVAAPWLSLIVLLASALIGSVQASFESLLWPLIITRTDAIRPIGVAISYLSAGFGGPENPGALEAALVLMVIPSIILALYVQKYIVEGFARALIIG